MGKLFKIIAAIRKEWDGTFIQKPLRCPKCNQKAQNITCNMYMIGKGTGYAKNKIGFFCVLCGYHKFIYKPPKINELELINKNV